MCEKKTKKSEEIKPILKVYIMNMPVAYSSNFECRVIMGFATDKIITELCTYM